MSATVFDASFMVSTLTQEDESADADAFVRTNGFEGAIAPLLLTWEVCNALSMKVRRGQIDAMERDGALGDFGQITFEWDSKGNLDTIAKLADRHRLSAYDAAYLELAKRLALPLASFDKNLRKAARAEGVELAV